MPARTIAEKIFEAHIHDEPSPGLFALSLDRILCHEITTPPAIDDLRERGMDRVFDPTRIKATIDHVAPPKDRDTAMQYQILKDWCRQHGIVFYDLGRHGICHALFPEKGYSRPGELIICGDSHTCTLGAFGNMAIGVGTTYLETGILTGKTFSKKPPTLRYELTGTLPHGVYAKDIILHIIAQYGVAYATGAVVEFTGPVAEALDMESRMTMTNMIAEHGGTSGIFYPDQKTLDYLKYRDPGIDVDNPDLLNYRKTLNEKTDDAILKEWRKWNSDPEASYQAVHKIDVSHLEPIVTALAPEAKDDKPSLGHSIRELEGEKIDYVFIGSCTNGRISDLRIVAKILKGRKIAPHVTLFLVPATTEIMRQAEQEGLIEIFRSAGAFIDSPSCSACLGMKTSVPPGQICASSSNRNFPGRMGKGARAQLMSPATAAASALHGKITDPREYL